MTPDCAHCRFFDSPKEHNHPLLTNRPGGLEGTKRALAYCSLPAQAKVVDIACGKGATIQLLRETYGYRAIGIDISGRMLKEAGNYALGANLVQGDCVHLPLQDESLDAVMMECAFHFDPNPTAVLGEMARILKPEGYLILSDLYLRTAEQKDFVPRNSVSSCLTNIQTRSQIFEGIEGAGFTTRIWADQDDLLKQWIWEMTFNGLSVRSFFASLLGEDCDSGTTVQISKPGSIGYYILVAQKTIPMRN